MNHHWINQGLVRKLKQNRQISKILKRDPYNYPVQMITNLREQDPKDTKIKIPRTTRDDKSFLSMSASHDGGRIPREKQKKKVPEPLVTVNKVNQDPDDTNEEAKVGSSNEGTK